MLGLGLEGRALVSEGELEEGMRRLDEATTVALQGEARLLYCVAWACCYLISACERVRDYERATQWCGRVGEFCSQHDIFLLNTCRAHYASVLSWQGRWEEAESQLSAAVEGLKASRPPMVGDALARLGDLRRRQGRLDDAEELFARTETHSLTLLGRAALALDRDEPSEAVELADRYLRRFPDPTRVERSAGLEVAIKALARLGSTSAPPTSWPNCARSRRGHGRVRYLPRCAPRKGRWRWPEATTTLRGARSKMRSTCSRRATLGSRPRAYGSTSPPR